MHCGQSYIYHHNYILKNCKNKYLDFDVLNFHVYTFRRLNFAQCNSILSLRKPKLVNFTSFQKMVRHYQKKIYQQYPERNLCDAVDAVKNGLSVRQASKRYNVPRSTLSDRVLGKVEANAKPGRKTTLPEKMEKAIAAQCMKAAESGFGLTPKQVRIRTGRLWLYFFQS